MMTTQEFRVASDLTLDAALEEAIRIIKEAELPVEEAYVLVYVAARPGCTKEEIAEALSTAPMDGGIEALIGGTEMLIQDLRRRTTGFTNTN